MTLGVIIDSGCSVSRRNHLNTTPHSQTNSMSFTLFLTKHHNKPQSRIFPLSIYYISERDGAEVSASGWGLGGPRFQSHPRLTFPIMFTIPDNPLTPAAVSKPLEMIGRSTYVLACSEPTAPYSDINQTAGSRGRLNMWKNRCMHAAVSAACRPAEMRRRRGEIGGIPRWIILGRIRPNERKRRVTQHDRRSICINQLGSEAASE